MSYSYDDQGRVTRANRRILNEGRRSRLLIMNTETSHQRSRGARDWRGNLMQRLPDPDYRPTPKLAIPTNMIGREIG